MKQEAENCQIKKRKRDPSEMSVLENSLNSIWLNSSFDWNNSFELLNTSKQLLLSYSILKLTSVLKTFSQKIYFPPNSNLSIASVNTHYAKTIFCLNSSHCNCIGIASMAKSPWIFHFLFIKQNGPHLTRSQIACFVFIFSHQRNSV